MVILIDDGSTNDTARLIKSYDPRVVYCYQSNQGPAAAGNKGVRLARGDYIAFCDHDDVWDDRHLERLMDCFTSYPDTIMAFDNAEYFGTGVRSRVRIPPQVSKALNHKKIALNFLFWKYPVASMSAVIVRKDCFERLGGLSESVGVMDDYHLYLRLAAYGDVRYVDFVGCRETLERRQSVSADESQAYESRLSGRYS